MDYVAFFLSTTGALVILGIAAVLWFILGKGTSSNAKMFNTGGKILAVIGALILIIPVFGGLAATTTTDNGTEIESNYSIVWALDSTTAVISGDFSQTDEPGSGEYSFGTDENGNTISVTLTQTCDYTDNACTWDAFSFSSTITWEAESDWDYGARVTSVLGVRVDPALLDWGIASNNTGGNPVVPFVDVDPLSRSGFLFTDGAGNNKAMQDTDVESINEFSPGESITAHGMYYAVNEDQMCRNTPAGVWTVGPYNVVYSDGFGFSHTIAVTVALTTQA